MTKIKGISVILLDKTEIGVDDFNHPIYIETEIIVDNVLIAPVKSEEVLTTQNLTGRTAVYTLAIPKNDNHSWDNKIVKFFDKRWRVFGTPLKGIDAMIPLDWNMKVMVERYE